MVLNGPQAMNAADNQVEIINAAGDVLAEIAGSKQQVADRILQIIQQQILLPGRG